MRWLLILIGFGCVTCSGPFHEESGTSSPELFESFWKEIDRHYSFFSYSKLDWDSVKTVYQPQITDATTSQELLAVFDEMLDLLHDPHTLLYSPTVVAGPTDYFDAFQVNVIDDMTLYFDEYQVINAVFDIGYLNHINLAYIRIKTFGAEAEIYESFDSLWYILSSRSGVIVDVRSNRGGMICNAEVILQSLADTVRISCWYRYRDGVRHSDFSSWEPFAISPDVHRSSGLSPRMMLLTNRQSFSACEWFVLSASAFPEVTVIGDTTGGGSGRPLLRELPNGWILQISNSQLKLPSGRDFQGTGLYPDIPVWISDAEVAGNIDAILETAIEKMSE